MRVASVLGVVYGSTVRSRITLVLSGPGRGSDLPPRTHTDHGRDQTA